MKTTRIAGLLTAAVLAFTGCQSGDTPETDPRSETPAPTSSQAPAAAAASPARIEREKVDKKPSRQIVTGSDRYVRITDANIDIALGYDLAAKADEFLNEHYLRPDRWAGKWYVKEGEMDAYRDKVTPELFADVDKLLTLTEADYAKHGPDSEKWPKKVLEAASERSSDFGYLFYNAGVGAGTGNIVYRGTRRTILRGTTTYGWEGDLVGVPITFAVFNAAHKVGSDGPTTVNMWQAWKKVKGEWLIFSAGWNTDQS